MQNKVAFKEVNWEEFEKVKLAESVELDNFSTDPILRHKVIWVKGANALWYNFDKGVVSLKNGRMLKTFRGYKFTNLGVRRKSR